MSLERAMPAAMAELGAGDVDRYAVRLAGRPDDRGGGTLPPSTRAPAPDRLPARDLQRRRCRFLTDQYRIG